MNAVSIKRGKVLEIYKDKDTLYRRVSVVRYVLLWLHKSCPHFICKGYDEKETLSGLVGKDINKKVWSQINTK
jgi:hypothetical protein